MTTLLDSIFYFSPELILALFSVLVLIGDACLPRSQSWRTMTLAFLGVAAAGVASVILGSDVSIASRNLIFSNQLSVDSFTQMFKIIVLVSTGLVILYVPKSRELTERRLGEYYMLILVGAIGMCMLASANTLLMVYLSIETMSLTSYLLVGFLKYDRRSSEASIKYLIFGAVSSGVMLYGISLLFGLTGTGDLTRIGHAINAMKIAMPAGGAEMESGVTLVGALQNGYGLWIGVMMVLGGVAYKISVFPFHFWAPDAYEGAPTPVASFLSVASKAAGFAVLIRLVSSVIVPMNTSFVYKGEVVTMPGVEFWPYLFALVAVLTMFLGNLAAIWQEDVKRMLAYSSVAHAGYMLVGIAVGCYAALGGSGLNVQSIAAGDTQGFVAVAFYLVIYAFMNIGAFLVAMIVINQEGGCKLEHFQGLVWRTPHLAIAMCIFLFGLAGLPPTGGFIGKFYLFKAAIDQGWYMLTILGLINSVISLYFYARVIKAMAFGKPASERAVHAEPLNRVVLGLCILPVMALGLFWWPVYQWAQESISIW